jgi:hypothetical protein
MMTITEAYERLEKIFPATASITVQVDTWKHCFQGKRDEIETGFLVSASDAPLFQGKSLEEAVVNAERHFAHEAAPQAEPAEIDVFLQEAESVSNAETR